MQIKPSSEHYIRGNWDARQEMLRVEPDAGVDALVNKQLAQKWQRYFTSAVSGGLHNPDACKVAARKLQQPTTGFACFKAPVGEPLGDTQYRAVISSPLARAQPAQKLVAFAPRMSTQAVRGWIECFLRELPDERYPATALALLVELEEAHEGVMHPAELQVIKAMKIASNYCRLRNRLHADTVKRGIQEAQQCAPHADDLQLALEGVLKNNKFS